MSGISGWRKKKMLAEVEKKKKNDEQRFKNRLLIIWLPQILFVYSRGNND